MVSYATLPQMHFLNECEIDGITSNNKYISYYQVESVLYSYPKVLEAGVIVQGLKGDHKILKVYLALEESFKNKEERENYCQQVENYIRQQFSIRMPINVLLRDKLPMTRSGKILRSVLYDY